MHALDHQRGYCICELRGVPRVGVEFSNRGHVCSQLMRWICPAPRHSMPALVETPVKGSSELPALMTPPRHTQRRQAAAACKTSPVIAAATGQEVHPDVLEVLFTEEEIHQATFKLGRCVTDTLTEMRSQTQCVHMK